MMRKPISQTEKVSKDDFNLISVIGTGSYGKVLLVKKKGADSKYYAMKIIKKKHIK
jgi:serine/threonine protein kinase